MLEQVVVIVLVEDPLDSILTVDCSNGNVLCGIRKNCEKQSCAPVNQSLFLKLPQMVFKKKNSTMLEEVVVSVWVEDQLDPFELRTVAMETYFAESAKSCEQQCFAPVNQSSFLRVL